LGALVTFLKDRRYKTQTITKRDTLSRQEVQAVEQIEEPAWYSEPRSLSQFLASMGHEIRTPLSSLLGFSDLIKDPAVSADERSWYVDILNRNGRQLLELIEDVLVLAKLEAGKLKVDVSPLSLVSLMTDVVGLHQFEASKKNIEFVFYPPPRDFPKAIHSDVNRIHQIFYNLISSAVKVTENGRVSIRLGMTKNQNGDKSTQIKIEHPGTIAQGLAFKPIVARFLACALGGNVRMYQREQNTTYLVTLKTMLVNVF